jgi:hypothetical protein
MGGVNATPAVKRYIVHFPFFPLELRLGCCSNMLPGTDRKANDTSGIWQMTCITNRTNCAAGVFQDTRWFKQIAIASCCYSLRLKDQSRFDIRTDTNSE